MFLGGNVTKHGSAEPTNLSGTNGRGNVVVGGRNVGNQWTEGVEWRTVALLDLALHILANLVHGLVTRTLNEHLHILVPRPLNQFAHGVQFGKLSTVVGIVG